MEWLFCVFDYEHLIIFLLFLVCLLVCCFALNLGFLQFDQRCFLLATDAPLASQLTGLKGVMILCLKLGCFCVCVCASVGVPVIEQK